MAQITTTKEAQIKITKDSAWVMELTDMSTSCTYMTQQEKEIMQWLNIARMYPRWFIYFNKLTPSANSYKDGLYNTLKNMKSIKEKLLPDSLLWQSALCHAKHSGQTGFTGHERKNSGCTKKYNAECIFYGAGTAQSIVLGLLTDQDVPSLGHRLICLSSAYKIVGVSLQEHKSVFRINTVLDFK